MKKEKTALVALILAACFYIVSGIMLYKGYDKMTNYYNGDYYAINAYVGGDAYNYIINGNYATGFFVLSMGFFLSGTVCLESSAIIKTLQRRAESERPAPEPEVSAAIQDAGETQSAAPEDNTESKQEI